MNARRHSRTVHRILLSVVVIAISLLVIWQTLPQLLDDLGIDLGAVSVPVDGPEGSWAETTSDQIDVAALEALTVAEVADRGDYDRDAFGPAWADIDHNGCDTRNDILNRDLDGVAYKSGTHDCVVTSGRLIGPYTGKTIDFERGNKTSTMVQIDHIIPLGAAWDMGAHAWDDEMRQEFANDPLNLVAVDGPTNGSKSDQTIGTWMPPNEAIHCRYGSAVVEIATTYELTISPADAEVLRDLATTCNG